ncbi:FliM/FliN family flagellar motor switch protein [Roseovarius sp. S1116L3]|uniref:FliM/FliN family flagellar motor switch protein n=1 Tax=Roseovarius roseus TaxID=3342636 RepID=UPI003729ADA3
MAQTGGNTVIHRKARASREEYQARAMSPAKALRLALAQASDTLFDLPMVVGTVEQVEISQTVLRGEFTGGGLMVLLDGPKGARGAVRIDDALLAALIEIQTTGRVTGRGTGGRAVTRTDAAIAAPLIDAALSGAEAKLAEDARSEEGDEAPPHWASGYRFGVMMEDARGMSLALGAAAFHVFRMMVEVGNDGHPGAVTFLLPVPEVPVRPAADEKTSSLQRTLEQSAMNAPVSLEAVLGRVTLPLEKVCKLEVGGLLPVTADQMLQVRLEASQKHVVAVGRLGQLNGARAVKLTPEAGGVSSVTRAQTEAGRAGDVAGTAALDMTRIADLAETPATAPGGSSEVGEPHGAGQASQPVPDKEMMEYGDV